MEISFSLYFVWLHQELLWAHNVGFQHFWHWGSKRFFSSYDKKKGRKETKKSGGYICTFSLLISLSIKLRTSKFRNQFTITSKYFDIVCYLKRKTYSGPISSEVQRNDIWTDNIESFEMTLSSTALGTRTGNWNPTRRGTDETPLRP